MPLTVLHSEQVSGVTASFTKTVARNVVEGGYTER